MGANLGHHYWPLPVAGDDESRTANLQAPISDVIEVLSRYANLHSRDPVLGRWTGQRALGSLPLALITRVVNQIAGSCAVIDSLARWSRNLGVEAAESIEPSYWWDFDQPGLR